MKTNRSKLPVALFVSLAVAGVAAPVTTAAGSKPVIRKISLLYSQTAPAGSLVPVKGTINRFVLRLAGVSNQVVWFSDRPARRTGVIPIRGFAPAWKGLGFVADPPNAVLTLLSADAQEDTIVLKLGRPRYDRRHHAISYPARSLGHATGNLAYYEATHDARVPRHFADASLFIDDASGPMVNGCVIAPYTVCEGADLTNAFLVNSDLSGADFTNADLDGANFSQSNLTNANLLNASLLFTIFCETTMPDGSINNSGC